MGADRSMLPARRPCTCMHMDFVCPCSPCAHLGQNLLRDGLNPVRHGLMHGAALPLCSAQSFLTHPGGLAVWDAVLTTQVVPRTRSNRCSDIVALMPLDVSMIQCGDLADLNSSSRPNSKFDMPVDPKLGRRRGATVVLTDHSREDKAHVKIHSPPPKAPHSPQLFPDPSCLLHLCSRSIDHSCRPS
jgi:hypothetical protein